MPHQKSFISVTTETVEHRNIIRTLGLVWSAAQTNPPLAPKWKQKRKKWGANAIVGVRITIEPPPYHGHPHKFFLYGTAVILEN